MDDRKKLTTMLKDFQREQQELLAQAEQRLEVNLKINQYQSKSLIVPPTHSRSTHRSYRKSKRCSARCATTWTTCPTWRPCRTWPAGWRRCRPPAICSTFITTNRLWKISHTRFTFDAARINTKYERVELGAINCTILIHLMLGILILKINCVFNCIFWWSHHFLRCYLSLR